jgi:hypothetical protein
MEGAIAFLVFGLEIDKFLKDRLLDLVEQHDSLNPQNLLLRFREPATVLITDLDQVLDNGIELDDVLVGGC